MMFVAFMVNEFHFQQKSKDFRLMCYWWLYGATSAVILVALEGPKQADVLRVCGT